MGGCERERDVCARERTGARAHSVNTLVRAAGGCKWPWRVCVWRGGLSRSDGGCLQTMESRIVESSRVSRPARHARCATARRRESQSASRASRRPAESEDLDSARRRTPASRAPCGGRNFRGAASSVPSTRRRRPRAHATVLDGRQNAARAATLDKTQSYCAFQCAGLTIFCHEFWTISTVFWRSAGGAIFDEGMKLVELTKMLHSGKALIILAPQGCPARPNDV